MRANNVLGLIFANANEDVISEITGVRSLASVPFGGGYRLIDFVLSNMVNAGMTKVGVITNNNYQSLMDHIGNGKPWDLSRKSEGLFLLPPFNSEAVVNYNSSRIGALKNTGQFLERSTEEYVLISDCEYVANIDFNEVFASHEKSGADITLCYKNGTLPDISSLLVFDKIEEDNTISKMTLSVGAKKKGDFGIKLALMKKSLLERLISESYAKGMTSFEKDVIMKNLKRLHINGFKIEGFCPFIDSLKSYYDANFALLNPDNYRQLFSASRPVYTKVHEDMPVVYGLGSEVKNSLVADGCIIDGEVENCILFRNCRVAKDAVVKNSLLMPNTYIADGAVLNCCITDKNVAVTPGKALSGADSYPVYIGRNIHI